MSDITPALNTFSPHAIAIVGLGGRFPGAQSLDEFWQNIHAGVESVETFSEEELTAAGVDARTRSARGYVPKGTVLADADMFDAAFFGYPPREAEILDPQHRIFLECAWEALEHAGYAAGSVKESVGIYAGASMNTYLLAQILRNPSLVATVGGYQLMLGNDKDYLCTRVSYKLDLRGPSVTVQTACSTSLVAVVMASRALARGECDIALAGGVSVGFPQRAGYQYQEGMILSPDGHCRPFDVRAAGTRVGQGCGIVVLKRLADAVASGDAIHAVIRGGAINNDGAAKAGFTAPSVDGQVEVIATAHALAGISARDISYVEAHGTATPLGDPIEVGALTQAFRASTSDVGFCRLGSLKANLGHLDAAAGVAGLIKTVLALKHQTLPPLVHFTAPNPQLELAGSPFVASASTAPWTEGATRRRAGVSSFGIGGTNAHVVLEEAPEPAVRPDAGDAHLLQLSARSESALERMTANLSQALAANPQLRLDDVEWTLQTGRRAFQYRRVVVVRDRAHAIDALSKPQHSPVLTARHEGDQPSVVFLFSGQGSQYAGMGARLYSDEPVYREAVDRCAALLQTHLGCDIRSVLFDAESAEVINATRLAQPALFVTEYALASLWASWGVRPAAMLGHSIGEYVAAHLSGVIGLEDALAVVAARGRLMQELPAGAMAAVHLSAQALKTRLGAGVEIAAINAPTLCTISGAIDAVDETARQLQASGVETRPLHTSHAFHSSMMEPVLGPFAKMLERVSLSPPTIPYVSNVTGTWITAAQATSPAYYADHLRSCVNFEAGVRTVAADASAVLLEVGPGNALTTLARLTLGGAGAKRTIQSMPRVRDERGDAAILREAAGRLWLSGTQLDSEGMHAGVPVRRVPLPTYPFERQRYFVEPSEPVAPAAAATPAQRGNRLDEWLYAPTWTRSDSAGTSSLSGAWLVLGDDDALSRGVIEALTQAGAKAVLVRRGVAFEKAAESFVVRPGSAEDIASVVEGLAADRSGAVLAGAIHLWSVNGALPPRAAYDALVSVGLGVGSRPADAPVRIIHASASAESVLDERCEQPETALALGPVLVLPTELANVQMRTVDLEVSVTGVDAVCAVKALLCEAAADDRTSRVAWRRGRRWVRRYEPTTLPAADGPDVPVKTGGVYLITGGTGGIGLTLARWLGQEFRARLLLTSRSALPPRDHWNAWLDSHGSDERASTTIATIREIETSGGEVVVAAADVADEAAMAAAIASARERWGRIDGVIHAAGIAGRGSIAALREADDTRAVLRPKVDGLSVLARLLGRDPLDFVALMSSINAVAGAPGLCDYTAANAVLDAFAESMAQPAAWRHVLSINWGPWRDVGMAANLAVGSGRSAQWQAFLAQAIPPRLGVEAFARALASRRSHLVVASLDFRADSLTASSATERGMATPVADGRAETPLAPVELALSSDPPSSDIERRLEEIWRALFGIGRVGRHDDFFELGGHSLLATRVLSHVQEAIGARLTLRDVFDGPTIAKMAERIEAQRAELSLATGGSAEEREEIEF